MCDPTSGGEYGSDKRRNRNAGMEAVERHARTKIRLCPVVLWRTGAKFERSFGTLGGGGGVMEPGIYTMSNSDYHRGPGKKSLSKGGLDQLAKSAAHYKAHLEQESSPTPAMIFGSQFHCAALEQDLFKKKYVVDPKIYRRTKAGKAEYAEFQASLEEKGQSVITQDNLDLINRMVESMYKSEIAASLLTDGIAESSIFWNHPKWGFSCKCRPDFLNEKHKIAIDLKTTTDASPQAFAKAIVNYKYHWQASHYLAGINQIISPDYEEFVFIAIEKTPPYAVQNYILKRDDIYLAEEQIKPLYAQFAECISSDIWPGPTDRIQVVDLPGWYYKNALD